ncbi:MAG: UDP-N-acetylmuramoyl-tripeptide--D-alanyl-D-alanine ligase [Leptospira sp.]|nr:UDP-N-acetylmuramoyl-tripeptide--D-alanyl-D-alanine ligase [Leptospira sp.]
MKEKFIYSIETVRKVLSADIKGILDWSENPSFANITTSSQEADNGSLFIPLTGKRDGHEFIRDAFSRGALFTLCIKNHGILKTFSDEELAKCIFVEDTLVALGSLAGFHRKRFRPFVVAVTGSSGKTTTKEILASAIRFLGEDSIVVTERNFNNEIGVPFTLFRINEKTRFAVIEMGMNHSGEISKLSKMAEPDFGIITNSGSAHIENLGSLKNIARAKAEITDGMKKKSMLFIPENIAFRKIFENACNGKHINLRHFGFSKSSGIEILNKKKDGFELNVSGNQLNWNFPGEKILQNLFGAISLLFELKFPILSVLNGISAYQNTGNRFVIEKSKFAVINDTYNANPESMISSLESAEQLSGGNGFYAILGDMKELGKFSKKFHKDVGKFAADLNVLGLVTFGSDSECILNSFLKSKKNTGLGIHFTADEESIKGIMEYVGENFSPGSFILIKGSRSMKMERIAEILR